MTVIALPRRSRFVIGALDWTTPLPVRAWGPALEAGGTRRVTASGVPAGERLRSDDLLRVTFRFHEEYWPEVEAFLLAGLTSALINWYPEAEDAGTVAPCYLHEPAPGEMWAAPRAGDYPRVLTFDVTLRLRTGSAPFAAYFEA